MTSHPLADAAILTVLVGRGDPAALAYVGAALRAEEGDCARAARRLSVSRQTVYRWRKRWPDLARTATEARQERLSYTARQA